jgi:hypothetical protein
MSINGRENQLPRGTGPGRTLILLNGVVAHPPYYDNETGSLSAYHIPTISSFQILLEMCLPTSLHGKNQFPITCDQTYKFEGCEIPRKRILRCIHVKQNLPLNILISLEFLSLPK